MTVPCSLADSTMYREVARRTARFYALRAASGTARSLRPQARFGAQPPHSGGSWRGDRHAPYITTRKRAFSASGGRHVCRPYGLPAKLSLRQNRGRGLPLPCRAMNFYCPVGRGDPTPPRDWAAAANFRLVSRFYTRTQKSPRNAKRFGGNSLQHNITQWIYGVSNYRL